MRRAASKCQKTRHRTTVIDGVGGLAVGGEGKPELKRGREERKEVRVGRRGECGPLSGFVRESLVTHSFRVFTTLVRSDSTILFCFVAGILVLTRPIYLHRRCRLPGGSSRAAHLVPARLRQSIPANRTDASLGI